VVPATNWPELQRALDLRQADGRRAAETLARSAAWIWYGPGSQADRVSMRPLADPGAYMVLRLDFRSGGPRDGLKPGVALVDRLPVPKQALEAEKVTHSGPFTEPTLRSAGLNFYRL
jgi:hypothetical protein